MAFPHPLDNTTLHSDHLLQEAFGTCRPTGSGASLPALRPTCASGLSQDSSCGTGPSPLAPWMAEAMSYSSSCPRSLHGTWHRVGTQYILTEHHWAIQWNVVRMQYFNWISELSDVWPEIGLLFLSIQQVRLIQVWCSLIIQLPLCPRESPPLAFPAALKVGLDGAGLSWIPWLLGNEVLAICSAFQKALILLESFHSWTFPKGSQVEAVGPEWQRRMERSWQGWEFSSLVFSLLQESLLQTLAPMTALVAPASVTDHSGEFCLTDPPIFPPQALKLPLRFWGELSDPSCLLFAHFSSSLPS